MSENNISFSTPTPSAYSLEEEAKAIQRVQAWKAALERAQQPMDDEFVLKVLGRTIKHDKENKLITFYGMVQNFTYEDQQNLMFSAPSSTGKSYIPLEVAKYFPKGDVDKKGFVSKKAFFHKNMQLQTDDGKPLKKRSEYIADCLEDWEDSHARPEAPGFSDKSKEAINARHKLVQWRLDKKDEFRKYRDCWDSIEKFYVLDLSKRIIIFKDVPDDQVLQPLRSLLSHDEKELIVEITDKTASGGNLTKKVKLIGYPTVVFCQAAFSPDEQERTRFFIISPDMDQRKLSDSLDLQAESLQDRDTFKGKIDSNPDGAALKARIELIKAANIQQIIIKPEDMEILKSHYKQGKDNSTRDLAPRDQRDFPRLVAMAKGHSLFNLPQREYTPGGNLTAKLEDLTSAENMLRKVMEANRLELPPYVYDWWTESLKQLLEATEDTGLTKTEFSQSYYKRFKSRLGDKSRKRLITVLEDAGFIEERTDPADKRTSKLYALGVGVENEKYISGTQPKLDPQRTLADPMSSGLKDKLERVISIFKEYPDEALSESTIFLLLEDPLKIPREEGRQLLKTLIQDGSIFEPRLGFYKLSGGG